jgi:hypothetical protein
VTVCARWGGSGTFRGSGAAPSSVSRSTSRIWIRDGKIIEPDSQVIEFLSHMFGYIQASGETRLQATMEVKILTKKK